MTPKANDKGELKYQASILVPKGDTETLKAIKAAVEYVKTDPASAKVWGVAVGKVPGELKTPLRDGATKEDERPEYAGHYFFNVTSAQKPGIVDKNLQQITDPSEIYSGCYARVSVNFYAFNNNGNRGIAVGLRNVQKLRDGEPLGGGRSRPEDDFGDSAAGDDFLG
jgi:hypothetical protein